MASDHPQPSSHLSSLISHFRAKRVPLAWFLLVAILCGAAVIVWQLAFVDAPPQGAAFVIAGQGQDDPSATITAFGVRLVPVPGATSAQDQLGPGSAADDGAGDLVHDSAQGEPTAMPAAPGVSDKVAQAPQSTLTVALISVYVSGAVSRPGVYTLPAGSRIDTALSAAGGALPDADLDAINLAERISDEEHIRVYHLGETAQATPPPTGGINSIQDQSTSSASPTARQTRTPPSTPAARPTGPATPATKPTPKVKININTATAEDLQQIPGIGPAIAQRIVADRKQNGPYKTVEDLMRISGIKEGILARLRDYVTVGP